MMRSDFIDLGSNFEGAAREAGLDLPLEQTSAWDRFEGAVEGREPWRKLAWIVDDEPRAFIALTKMRGRGFTYLWAKHGPVWAGLEPSADEEARLRSDLIDLIRSADRSIAFARLHAKHRASDLHELLQSVTFDRTVVLDLTVGEEALMAGMKKRGRRDVRKALRDETLVVGDETERAADVFPELYELLVETGERDSFGISERGVYESMLAGLGPEHCRLYAVRRDGRPLCWGIVTKTDTQATYYYAASNEEGRKSGAPDLLVWSMSIFLSKAGVRSFDLMGIDSDRAPQLAGVRGFKTKFSEEITEVAGAWDVAVSERRYALLVRALAGKRAAIAAVGGLREKATRLVSRFR
ncbi:MAG: peptidoglycan bridge formation glycyltransferase FemA/FemB family protein [Actinomycetaceae bacterium]|nr:peptidoglycan bridge formation glycyltransferase FemA/FemB family protein [Actinomycetaceae bacterium]